MTRELFDDDPPPVAATHGRPMILIASGVVLALLLLIIVMNLNTVTPSQTRGEATPPPDDDDIAELLPPRLTDEQLEGGGQSLGGEPQLRLEAGGWIQVPDPDDPTRLAQRYRCERLDPNPEGMGPGWVEMTDPRAELYLSTERIVTMEGESALVFLNNRAMESGRLTGAVVIRMYDADENGVLDLDGPPQMVVHAQDADLDNFLGEVRCEGDIFVSTTSLDFQGRDLTMRFNDKENRIESLTIERPDLIRIAGDATRDRQAATPAYRPSPRAVLQRTQQSPADAASTQFYRLNLRDNVRITQGDQRTGRAAFGDALDATFSLESGEVGSLAMRPAFGESDHPANNAPIIGPQPALVTLHRAAQAVNPNRAGAMQDDIPPRKADPRSLAPRPGPDDIYINSDGRLAVQPVTDPAEMLDAPEHARIDLIGAPVQLHDFADDTRATCAQLRYDAGPDVITLTSNAAHRLRIEHSQFDVHAEQLRIAQVEQVARLIGPGEMILRSDEPGRISARMSDASAVRLVSAAPHHVLLALQDDADSVADSRSAPQPRLRITWEEGVELDFADVANGDDADAARDRRLRSAAFRGNVNVHSPEFALRADAMDVGFAAADASNETDDAGADDAAPRASGDQRRGGMENIRSIFARGDVRASAPDQAGTLTCSDLQLWMIPGPEGSAIPSEMIATGDIEAGDAEQRMWTRHLHVTFAPAPPSDDLPDEADDESATATAPTDGAAGDDSGVMGSMRAVTIKRAIADEGVQVRQTNGERIFAEKMVADGDAETIEFTGQDVRIYADNVLIRRGQRLLYNQRDGKASSDGPGELTVWPESIQPAETGPIDPPAVEGDPLVRAQWNDRMMFDDRANDGGGYVELQGDVAITSQDNNDETYTYEERRIRSQSLAIDFARDAQPGLLSDVPTADRPRNAPRDTPRGDTPGGDTSVGDAAEDRRRNRLDDVTGRSRNIRHFVAAGDAQMDSITWAQRDRADEPDVISITGDHIEHDVPTAETHVRGEGRLLVHRRTDQPANIDDDASATSNFAGRGTSRFQWSDHLHAHRELDNVYHIDMQGNVRVEHRAPDDAITTLTSQTLRATVVQDTRPGDASPQRDATDELIPIGGEAQLRRLAASGQVFIRSDAYDVDCDSFDYNVATARAELRADTGRTVTIHNRQTVRTTRHASAVWIMDESNRIIIDRAGGAIGR